MKYRSCVVVLVGSETASRPWIQYEIEHTWKEGKGIVCINIHDLRDSNGHTCIAGINPLALFCIDKTFNYIVKHSTPADRNEKCLSDICKSYKSSAFNTYKDIENNIENLIEEAITIRN